MQLFSDKCYINITHIKLDISCEETTVNNSLYIIIYCRSVIGVLMRAKTLDTAHVLETIA